MHDQVARDAFIVWDVCGDGGGGASRARVVWRGGGGQIASGACVSGGGTLSCYVTHKVTVWNRMKPYKTDVSDLGEEKRVRKIGK